MFISADAARKYVADIEKRYEQGRLRKLEEWEYGWGMNTVSDHDEDYVFDALFDVPNR